jgi:hypothetical protein
MRARDGNVGEDDSDVPELHALLRVWSSVVVRDRATLEAAGIEEREVHRWLSVQHPLGDQPPRGR